MIRTNATKENYKSIKQADISLTNLNILIGANGAGKSNFIGFFSFLQQMLKQNLRSYVMDKGGQDVFLYYGRKKSDHLRICIDFALTAYNFILSPTNENIFRFNSEGFDLFKNTDRNYTESRALSRNSNKALTHQAKYITGNSRYESLIDVTNTGDSHIVEDYGYELNMIITNIITKLQVFHFHDTSDTSPLKAVVANNDNLYLRSDGANLAAMLKLVYDNYPDYYRLIVDTVQLVIPDFHDFVIRDSKFITLEWFNKNNVDVPWMAHYLSDGSLRFIALAILLLMPTKLQPETIIIDEPELGLHPTAINVLSGLIKRASQDKQVIISTQSPSLLASVSPQDVIVVDKKNDCSEFRRLEEKELATWLQDFSLSELWDMNILGGRP